MKKLILSILIVGIAMLSRAQDPMIQQTVEDILESAGENISDDTDIQEVLDDLIRFRQKPLKINSADAEKDMKFHFIFRF